MHRSLQKIQAQLQIVAEPAHSCVRSIRANEDQVHVRTRDERPCKCSLLSRQNARCRPPSSQWPLTDEGLRRLALGAQAIDSNALLIQPRVSQYDRHR